MKAYMIFSNEPPPGCDINDELLVSLTYSDVIEAYDEFYQTGDAPTWDKLSEDTQWKIFKAVGESGVDLESIFDELVDA